MAREYGVKFYERSIFIDDKNLSVVKQNLAKAIKIADKNKFVIAIGHVGPAGGKITAQAIKEFYEGHKDQKVKFISLNELNNLGF